jgi:hypothetical protein
VVTDQIDRPCAEQEKRRSEGDDGSPDHGAAPVQNYVMWIGLLCFRHNIGNSSS